MRMVPILPVLVIIGILWYFWVKSPMTWQRSSSGKMYRVKRGPGQEAVADRLEYLSGVLTTFLNKADDMYPHDPRIANIRARWSGTLAEVEHPGDIAYSLNKNAVHVCVRTADSGMQDANSSVYVLLHELAHVATDEYGHPPEFWVNFRWILEVAEKLGVYEYQDFDATKVTFCGHDLGNNVLSCVKRKTCRSLL